MRVLIFGGTGFLGKNLVEYLMEKKYDIGMYIRPHAIHQNFIQERKTSIELYCGEFQSEGDFRSIVHGYDVVYHLISSTVPGIVNPLQEIETTIKPSLRLLEACVKESVKKIIFFSSGGTVYGVPKVVPIQETYFGQPISSYGIQKQTLERYLQFYQYTYNLPIMILRIANPYGRYQRPFSQQGLIANFLGRFLTGMPVEIWGDGGSIRDYICVSDVINAAERVLHYDGPYNVFNIGSGKGESINDIVQIINQLTSSELMIKRYSGRKVDVPANILDVSRARNELGWTPTIPLTEGIREMLSYWNPIEKNFEGR